MRGSTRQVVVCVSHLEVGGGWYGGERRGDVTVGGDVVVTCQKSVAVSGKK